MEKALFWDFDGTLAYGSNWSLSLYNSLKDYGYNVDLEKIKKHLSSHSDEQVKVIFPWHTPNISYREYTGEKWWDFMFEKIEPFYNNYNILKKDRSAINLRLKKYITDYNTHILYDDTIITLNNCKKMGYKNHILSNNYPELIQIIQELGLSEYFTHYIISANVGYEKPKIELYQYAMELADYPDICYMIGDNPIADIEGGKAAGMKTILVHNQSDVDADYKCNNLSIIPQFLIP